MREPIESTSYSKLIQLYLHKGYEIFSWIPLSNSNGIHPGRIWSISVMAWIRHPQFPKFQYGLSKILCLFGPIIQEKTKKSRREIWTQNVSYSIWIFIITHCKLFICRFYKEPRLHGRIWLILFLIKFYHVISLYEFAVQDYSKIWCWKLQKM